MTAEYSSILTENFYSFMKDATKVSKKVCYIFIELFYAKYIEALGNVCRIHSQWGC